MLADLRGDIGKKRQTDTYAQTYLPKLADTVLQGHDKEK
jgi:hypothetical protein